MALTPIKALLFLAGGAAAAGGVAYVSGVFDPYLGGEAPKLAAAPVPEASEADPKAPRLPQPPVPNALSADAPAATVPAVGAPAKEEILPPSFDVVRVEGDGSIVIAGKAAAGATVEIVTGARVIGNAVTGPDGDFAVVIDEPLKPGGYQIVLRSTAPDNVVATSLETAVVSIPEKPDGQVLALVEKPGEPSKLITVPEPQPAPPLSGDAAAPETPASAETAPATPEEKPTSDEAEASASAEAEAPAEEAPSAEQPAAAQAPEPAPADAASGKPAEQATAAKPDQEPVQLTPSAPSGEPQVAVEAVEIEGRKVFVAGVADPGRKVRVYANDILLGDADASPSGRFLIETERDLPVGDYIIRADALEPDGVKVAARAAVPFEREEGENLAAVAPSAPQAEAPATGADQSAAAAPNAAEPQPAPPTPAKPSAEPDAKSSAEAQASTEAPASGEPSISADTPAAPDATPSTTPPATADASPPASGAEAQQPAAPAPTAEADAPSTQPAEQPGESAAASAGSTTAPASESTPAASAEAETAKAATSAEVAPAPAGTPLAPKLESAPGAVIIRRGDSLWRISRRVYGLGVRYSTIYLANQEQISDPDRIWPGQVFKVPEKTSEGEEADMKAVGEQAVRTTIQ
jgi:nucleoid-associated protein YgaU